MIAKWLEEAKIRGDIIDYTITYNDVKQEYLINYYVKPAKTIPFIILNCEIDCDGNIEFLEEGEESAY